MIDKEEVKTLFMRLRTTKKERDQVYRMAQARNMNFTQYFRFCIQKVECSALIENAPKVISAF